MCLNWTERSVSRERTVYNYKRCLFGQNTVTVLFRLRNWMNGKALRGDANIALWL